MQAQEAKQLAHELRLQVSLAEMRLRLAKALLEEARGRLREAPLEVKAVQESYKRMEGPSTTELAPRWDSAKQAFEAYLEAYKDYLIALMEHDRLQRELALLTPAYHPAPTERVPGPTGLEPASQSAPPKVPNREPDKPPAKRRPPREPTPTRESIRKTVEEAAREQTKGNDRKADELLERALADAVRRLRDSTGRLVKTPTVANIRETLGDTAMVQSLGSAKDEEEDAFRAAADAARTIDKKAEEAFRRTPTTENMRKRVITLCMSEGLGNPQAIELPPGVRRRLPPGPYVVQEGESLSQIAERFYGQESLWDAIYVANMGVIGNNPDRILTGITLDVP